LKSKGLENEDDSTSSDSYSEKVLSIIIIEKFNKINGIIKELREKCKIFLYNSIIYIYFYNTLIPTLSPIINLNKI
jgi:hypothetical protein